MKNIKYTIYVDDNFYYMDESKRYKLTSVLIRKLMKYLTQIHTNLR